MQIRIRAILVIVLTNSMIILLSFLAGTGYVRENIEKYIETDMMVVADMANQFISSELNMLKYEADDIAANLVAAEPDEWPEILQSQARQFPKFIGISIMSATGEIMAGVGEKPASADIFGNEAVKKAFGGRKAFTSTVPATDGVVFYLAAPIVGMDKNILLLTLDGMYFSELASEYKIWETGHVFIDDSDGYVIANIRSEWVQTRQNFILQAQSNPQYEYLASVIKNLTAGERGIGYYSLDGIARICAYRSIEGSEEGWCLGIVAPLSESPVGNVDRGIFAIAAISFLLNIIAAFIASIFIKRPYEKVATLKEEAEAGLSEQKKMMGEIEQRDHLLQIVNLVIDRLLRSEPEMFTDTLHECMGMMAQAIGADRMYIYKNHTEDEKLYNTKLYEWTEAGQQSRIAGRAILFLCEGQSLYVRDKLSQGESIHSLVRNLPPLCRECLDVHAAQAVMIIPIFLHNEFWGFVGFDNCHSERMFTATEEYTMRSGSLLVVSALLRNEYMIGLRDASDKMREAEERARLMLDATPLACRLWDRNSHIFECNEAAVTLYDLRDKQEYMNRYFDLLPEYQPDGQKSIDKIYSGLSEAFEKGTCSYQVMFQLLDGTPMPAENMLFRVPYEDDYVVAAYTLDLREQKKMITEIENTSAQLAVALTDAQEANNAKSNFLAHMSHEIRTPLNAVVGFSELALSEDNLNEETAEKLDKIHASGMTILSIVNDILDISKIESGNFEIYPTQYDTPSLINDIIAQNIVRIGEKPIIFKLNIDENLPVTLYGDDLRVKQVFNNLLSNAFKYTNAGTVEWQIGFEIDDDNVWLVSSVRDTGIGMKQEAIQKLFSEYNQVDTMANRRVEGTGLGLAITKRLVAMMDGTVMVESEYGKGSVFSVRLRQAFVSGVAIGKTVAENLAGLRYTFVKRDSNKRSDRINLSYAHVLVVDDLATNLDIVKGMLKPYKVQTDCVMSGARAIEMIRLETKRYSAIFMDHMMPEMDGIEATRIIREIGTEYARHIPIIALTANAIVGNEEMFLGYGFQDFISKPIDMAKLDLVLRRWVRNKALEKEFLRIDKNVSKSGDAVSNITVGKPSIDDMVIEGLDVSKALERFGGNEEVLVDVLCSYAKNTLPLLKDLEKHLETGNLADYAITVHGVKGSSYGICAEKVGKAAEALEIASRSGDIATVNAGHMAFAVMVKLLLGSIDRVTEELDCAVDKPSADDPDPASLAELREACKAFDVDRVDNVMKRLESFRYENGENLIRWLREQIDKMAFEVVASGGWPSER